MLLLPEFHQLIHLPHKAILYKSATQVKHHCSTKAGYIKSFKIYTQYLLAGDRV